MKPDIIDNMEPEEILGTISTSEEVSTDPIEERLADFPLLSHDNKIGKYVMRFPKRFKKLWVIKPIDELADYPSRFKEFRRIKGIDIIKPFLIDQNGSLVPGVPYDWFYNVFMGNPEKNLEPLFTPLHKSKDVKNNSGDQDFDYLFADKIISYGDIHLIDLWWCEHFDDGITLRIFANKDLPLWLSFLKSQIPTELVSEEIMEKNAPSIIKVKGLVKRNPNDETIENLSEVMEALGCYLSGEKILICPKRIRKVANDLGIDPNILFCIVYIHELAHAAMDPSIDAKEIPYYGDYEYSIIKSNGEYKFDDASNFMEESLANLIMLKYFKCYSEIEKDESYFDTAVRFVSQQAPMYKLGLYQYEMSADWTKWREYKSREMKVKQNL